MTKEDYEKLKDVDELQDVIRGCDLKNQKDRTLLYGYTCEREDFHVYIQDGIIYRRIEGKDIYDYERISEEYITNSYYGNNNWYIPDKRLYPECCDMEFCTKLKEDGMLLPFTTFGQITETKEFYGKL